MKESKERGGIWILQNRMNGSLIKVWPAGWCIYTRFRLFDYHVNRARCFIVFFFQCLIELATAAAGYPSVDFIMFNEDLSYRTTTFSKLTKLSSMTGKIDCAGSLNE